MSRLVTVGELIAHIGDEATGKETFLQSVLDAVEDMLQKESGHNFADGGTITNEVHDGTGTANLYADRPIKSLTLIQTGRAKDRTIDHTDVDILVWSVGSRRLSLINRVWPDGLRNVWLSYKSQDDLPDLAKLAVKDVSVMIFNRLGDEHLKSEKMADTAYAYITTLDESSFWSRAVALLHRPALG